MACVAVFEVLNWTEYGTILFKGEDIIDLACIVQSKLSLDELWRLQYLIFPLSKKELASLGKVMEFMTIVHSSINKLKLNDFKTIRVVMEAPDGDTITVRCLDVACGSKQLEEICAKYSFDETYYYHCH